VVRSALITGGSSGIGLAIARMLPKEKIEAAATEIGAHAIAADVGKEEDCIRVVAEHKERFGGMDMLVNSAGIGIAGTVEAVQTKHIDLQLGINLRGLLLVTRESIPLLKESKGWVINLASIAGTAPTPGLTVYGATKAAVIALTRSMNAELDGDGVRAIALCPGFVDTPMAQWSGLQGDEMIQPEDCAEVVRMCLRLSPRARIPQVVIERVGSPEGVG
jgi:NAD(P)-dependent dehydrogenase (short-subunit alcohol dehydrogenase family)